VGGAPLEARKRKPHLPRGNLIVNPGAESGVACAVPLTGAETPTGWTQPLNVPVCGMRNDNTDGWPNFSDYGTGSRYFAGSSNVGQPQATLSQTIKLPKASWPIIDKGGTILFASGAFGGSGAQNDRAELRVSFRDKQGGTVGGTTTVGPVSAADRGNATILLHREKTIFVGALARFIKLELVFTREIVDPFDLSPSDGYADNLRLIFKGHSMATGIDLSVIGPFAVNGSVRPRNICGPGRLVRVFREAGRKDKLIGASVSDAIGSYVVAFENAQPSGAVVYATIAATDVCASARSPNVTM
jgi:hypothetical protein